MLWGLLALGLGASALGFFSFQVAHHPEPFSFDAPITRWIQSLEFPGLHSLLSFFSNMAAFEIGVTVSLPVFTLLSGRYRLENSKP